MRQDALDSPLPRLGLGGLFWLLAQPVQADGCEQLPPPSVTVRRLDEPVATKTGYGYRALNAMGAQLARPGQQILGLTQGNAVVQFASKIPSRVDRTGRWECASPQLTLTYGFRPMTVYVAREFPEGSCAYREILAHEARHVKTYQEHVASIEKELTGTLVQRFATGAPWLGPVGRAEASVQRELEERWIPYVQRLIARGDLAQRLIDTPEEYERVASACNGEIRNRIR